MRADPRLIVASISPRVAVPMRPGCIGVVADDDGRPDRAGSVDEADSYRAAAFPTIAPDQYRPCQSCRGRAYRRCIPSRLDTTGLCPLQLWRLCRPRDPVGAGGADALGADLDREDWHPAR